MGRVAVLPALVCLAWLTQPPRALAQIGGINLNRPSLEAPSGRVGNVGGRFTQLSPQVLDVTPRIPNVGLPSLSMAQPPGRRGRTGGRTSTPMKLGMVASPGAASLFRNGFLSDFDVGAASGFDISVSPDTPLYGWPGLNMVPGQETPLQAEKSEGSAYHRFFDLAPTRPPSGGAPESFSSLLGLAEQHNQDRLQELREQAFSVFAEATADRTSGGDVLTDEQRMQRLRQAARLFGAARDLTRAGQTAATEAPADLPILDVLEAHTRLECNRNSGFYVDQVLSCLMKAARDDPDAFHRLAQARQNPGDDQPIAAYFGDYRDGRSSMLERQMLQYVRVATVDTPTLDSLMLQAYCAWVLNDSTRASRALDEAERALRERPADQSSENWGALIAALRYAL